MKLRDFQLLTDENIDPDVVKKLRTHGFSVKDVKESGLQGTDDESLIALAAIENRVIITEDGDFADIIFTKKPEFVGVVHFRPGSFFLAFHLETLAAILSADPDLQPPFILTAENKGHRVRIKVRNALPGPSWS